VKTTLGDAQDQEGDHVDGHLRANSILGRAYETGDVEALLYPAKEQLNLTAALVNDGDLLGGAGDVIGHQQQRLSGVGLNLDLPDRVMERVSSAWRHPARKTSDTVGARDHPVGQCRVSIRVNVVFFPKRVTKRHSASCKSENH